MTCSARTRACAALAGLVASAGALVAQQQPAQDESVPTFRASVNAVQVSAIVTDMEGNSVAGLTKADFEIIEDGVSRSVNTFAAVDLPTNQSSPRLAPDVADNETPPSRVYLIVLDDMPASSALRTRHFLRTFIEQYFGPNDLGAVVLTTRGPAESGQAFTGNPQLLLDAIDKFGGGDARDSLQMRSKNVLGSLLTLTQVLAEVPAQRKALLFMGTGLGCPNIAACDAERLIGFRMGILGGAFQEMEPDFHRIVSAATRGNVTIYPINPNGLTTDLPAPESFETSFGDEEWELRKLAEITGGFALARSNRYDAAFERIVRENSTYYVLGFDSGYDARDGRYIPVEVRVTRPGLQVRSIAGYLAPRDKARETRVPETVHKVVWEAVARPMATSGLPMRLFAAPFRQGDGKDAVIPLALEIDAATLNLIERGGAYRGQLDIVVAVTDARNRSRRPVRHRAVLAFRPETYERLQREPVRVVAQLELPEGHYQIRASAGDTILAGSVVSDLIVPDFRDDFSLSGVSLSSSLTDDTFTVSPHRQIDVALPAAPTTTRSFAREDVLTVYAEAYENRRRSHTAGLVVELTNARGEAVVHFDAEHRSPAEPRSATVHRFLSTLDLSDVPPGAYVLAVEARSSLDDDEPIIRKIPVSVR